MTCGENLARLLPLHYQRIVELTHEYGEPSQDRANDLGGLFLWEGTREEHYYWYALATGRGL